MKKGGYQIINLEGRNFTEGEGQQFDGLYELIEGTDKTVYVSGVTINNTEYRDGYYSFRKVRTKYYLTGNEVIIEIADTDVVTVCLRIFESGSTGTFVGSNVNISDNVFRLLCYGDGKIKLNYQTEQGISVGFFDDPESDNFTVLIVGTERIHVGTYDGTRLDIE